MWLKGNLEDFDIWSSTLKDLSFIACKKVTTLIKINKWNMKMGFLFGKWLLGKITDPHVLLGIFILLLVGYIEYWIYHEGYSNGLRTGGQQVIALQTQWDKDKLSQQIAFNAAQRKAIIAANQASITINEIQDTSNAKINDLNTKLTNVTNSLRSRPDRPDTTSGLSVPSTTISGKTYCTAGNLYRSDAQDLVNFAGNADKEVIQKWKYYNQYIASRQMIIDYNNSLTLAK